MLSIPQICYRCHKSTTDNILCLTDKIENYKRVSVLPMRLLSKIMLSTP